jgi:hypothetical protein
MCGTGYKAYVALKRECVALNMEDVRLSRWKMRGT